MNVIGGVGQLIYHLVRFKEYELDYVPNNVLIARPYCQKGYEPELYTKDSPSGAELTASVFNLAKKIDDPSEERPYTDLIIEWCKKYGHPYAIDSIPCLIFAGTPWPGRCLRMSPQRTKAPLPTRKKSLKV